MSCFLSDVLRIFGVLAVCVHAFAERDILLNGAFVDPRLGVLNEMQFYESYDSYKLTRSLN